jgi:hypothetical protein
MRAKKQAERTMPFPLRLEPPLRAKLQALADRERRSLTNYLLWVLEQHVEQASRKTAEKPRRSR